MATPYGDWANLRIHWLRPVSGVVNLRSGPGVTVESIAIEGHIKLSGETRLVAGEGELPGSAVRQTEQAFSGRLTRWAPVPSGESWLDPGTSWTWTDTGRRPDRLRANGQPYDAFFGTLAGLPSTDDGVMGQVALSLLGSLYGAGGIGALEIQEAGELLQGVFIARR